MPHHNFAQSHDRGKAAEHFIYEVFQAAFNVIPASPDLQSAGIDFTFIDRATNQQHFVELKTDWTAHKTGNAFIEMVSVDTEGKLGWTYTSTANWLLYFIPDDRRIYRISLEVLRSELPAWQIFPTRTIPNKGRRGSYNTIGLLVPLGELYRIANEVIEL